MSGQSLLKKHIFAQNWSSLKNKEKYLLHDVQ